MACTPALHGTQHSELSVASVAEECQQYMHRQVCSLARSTKWLLILVSNEAECHFGGPELLCECLQFLGQHTALALRRLDMVQVQSPACRLQGGAPGAIRAGPPGFPRPVQSQFIDEAEHLALPPSLLQLGPLLRPLPLALVPAQATAASLPRICVQSRLGGRQQQACQGNEAGGPSSCGRQLSPHVNCLRHAAGGVGVGCQGRRSACAAHLAASAAADFSLAPRGSRSTASSAL